MFSCVEKDELSTDGALETIFDQAVASSTTFTPSEPLMTKARVDSTLFNIELIEPKLRERVEGIRTKYSKSFDLTPEETGYPVWGAIMGNEKLSVIPTVRPDLNLSYEFIVIQTDEYGQQSLTYFNALDHEDVLRVVNILTYPILTEESRKDIYKGGSITLFDIVIDEDDEDDISANPLPYDCTTLTFVQEFCMAVSSPSLDIVLCCKCETEVTRTVVCSGGGGSGGGTPGVSTGGGGGGNSGNNTNNNGGNTNVDPNLDDFHAHLDSMRNEAPDQIVNNVDCAQDPCLCEVINSFSENPDLFENLSNEVSQLLQTIFNIPNYNNIIITTSAVEGFTMPAGVIAQHNFGNPSGSFPVLGMAYSEITFNSDYGMNCTQAHLASTLLHESMHAYIEVQRAVLTPTAFTALYPMYSTGFDQNSAHHTAIANNYIVALTQSLHNMYPGLTPEFLEALTWQGLERTPAYGALIAGKPLGFEARMQEITRIVSCQGAPYSPQELNALGLESCF
ncbi:MAG: hypothetical protein ACI819_000342 [Neolewinella sp.]|jgi:hypothetical protein